MLKKHIPLNLTFRSIFYTLLVVNILFYLAFSGQPSLINLVFPVLELTFLLYLFLVVSSAISIFSQSRLSVQKSEKLGSDFKDWNFQDVEIHWINSKHPTAFVLALTFKWIGVKKLFLSKALRESLTENEFLAVIGHELGHLHFDHHSIRFNYLSAMPLLFLLQLNFYTFLASLLPINSTIFSIIIGFGLIVLSAFICVKILNYQLQQQEFEADQFVINNNLVDLKDLKSALLKLHPENEATKMKSNWLQTHPSLNERLARVA